VRVRRLADGTPLGKPLRGHTNGVQALAVGALPDGTPVIVSCGGFGDGTVRVRRLAAPVIAATRLRGGSATPPAAPPRSPPRRSVPPGPPDAPGRS
jgi:hypothetical protein